MIKLWRKNNLGIGTWRIWNVGSMVCYAHSTVEGGAEIMHQDLITLNQSGRTLEEQIQLEITSRVRRQLDKGYKVSRELAEALGSTNQLGLVNPMLALSITKVKVPQIFTGHVQRKYDGHRCLITRQGGDIVAYSRKGKLITTINHILQPMDHYLPDGVTLDGELYIHGLPLQTIASIIKREQPDNINLKYHWYDVVTDEPFNRRHAMMCQLGVELVNDHVELVPTYTIHNLDEAYKFFELFRSEGYEGAMLRMSLRGYEDATRTNQLLKLKEREDAEVTVLDIFSSKDGWAICKVRTDWGTEFDISAPGSVPEKTEVLQHFSKYIGRRLTIEYACLTKDRIPFHAVAIRWREDL